MKGKEEEEGAGTQYLRPSNAHPYSLFPKEKRLDALDEPGVKGKTLIPKKRKRSVPNTATAKFKDRSPSSMKCTSPSFNFSKFARLHRKSVRENGLLYVPVAKGQKKGGKSTLSNATGGKSSSEGSFDLRHLDELRDKAGTLE